MTNQTTVFIVEDDEEFAQLMRMRLEGLGYRVFATTNGDEAYDLIRDKLPDLVILDIFLPDMDGLTILKRLKSAIDIESGKTSLTKDIPVIIITGKAPMIENMTRIEGASDFFVKPVHVERLISRVSQLVELSKHDREAK